MADILVAYDQNRAIGRDGDLPWGRGLPSDLKRFKELTTGKSVIMGRKTFESIGRPLPNRENIVLSTDLSLKIDGAFCVGSIDQAIRNAQFEPIIIGGSTVYRQALDNDLVERVLATEVGESFDDTDTFFPELSEDEWIELSRESFPLDDNRKDQYPFDYVTYLRTTKKVAA